MKGNFIYKRLGENILKERKRKSLSQEALALLSSVDRTFVGRMEQGKANPSFKTLYKIARALKVKTYELLLDV